MNESSIRKTRMSLNYLNQCRDIEIDMCMQEDGKNAYVHRSTVFILLLITFFGLGGCDKKGTVLMNEGGIAVNNIEIYCKALGEGEPIVIAHGGPGLDHTYLLPQMKVLAQNYKLIFYDQRGSGNSTGEVNASSMTIDQFVEDLEGLRKQFKLEKMNLLGHSWGGLLAMNYAIKYPESLKSLTLVSAPGGSSASMAAFAENIVKRRTPEIDLATNNLTSSEAFGKAEQSVIEEFARLTFSTYFYNNALLDNLTLRFNENTAKNILPIYSAFGPYLSEYNIVEDLANISCPTLIIHGDYDPIPIQFAADLQKHILNSKLIVLEQCGHFPFIEAPEQFFATIRDFLETPFE